MIHHSGNLNTGTRFSVVLTKLIKVLNNFTDQLRKKQNLRLMENLMMTGSIQNCKEIK